MPPPIGEVGGPTAKRYRRNVQCCGVLRSGFRVDTLILTFSREGRRDVKLGPGELKTVAGGCLNKFRLVKGGKNPPLL
jgi:hypothetical protein